eukprot:scaffold12875_cov126-Isochrysis_galbana.AAC.1
MVADWECLVLPWDVEMVPEEPEDSRSRVRLTTDTTALHGTLSISEHMAKRLDTAQLRDVGKNIRILTTDEQ